MRRSRLASSLETFWSVASASVVLLAIGLPLGQALRAPTLEWPHSWSLVLTASGCTGSPTDGWVPTEASVGWIRVGGGTADQAGAVVVLPGYAGWHLPNGTYLAWVSFGGPWTTRGHLVGSGQAKYVVVRQNRQSIVSLACTGQTWDVGWSVSRSA